LAAIPASIAARPVGQVRPLMEPSPLARVGISSGVSILRGRLAFSQARRSPAAISTVTGRAFTINVSPIAPTVSRDASGSLIGGGILVNNLT
jgi:hypothetical protein